MPTTVAPESFDFVSFEASEIASLTDELAAKAGIAADAQITVEVDESSLLGHTELVSSDPILIRTQSGAFEDPRRLRKFSTEHASDVLGRYLLRAADRRTGGFENAPVEDEVTIEQRAAWDAFAAGRLARLGYPVRRQRFLYAFRNRHGFTDAADAAFETLWHAETLSWDALSGLSAETAAQNPGALHR